MEAHHLQPRFAEALIHDRGTRRLTQTDLAKALGTVSQSVSKWELGISLPRDHRLRQLAKFFGDESQTAGVVREILDHQKQKLLAKALRTWHPNDPDVMHMAYTQRGNPQEPSELVQAKNLLALLPDNRKARFAEKLLDAAAELDRAKERMRFLMMNMSQEINRVNRQYTEEPEPDDDQS